MGIFMRILAGDTGGLDINMEYVVEPGTFTIMVGNSSQFA